MNRYTLKFSETCIHTLGKSLVHLINSTACNEYQSIILNSSYLKTGERIITELASSREEFRESKLLFHNASLLEYALSNKQTFARIDLRREDLLDSPSMILF